MTTTMTTRPEQGPTAAAAAGTDAPATDGSDAADPGLMLPDGRCSSEVPLERLEADMLGLAGQLAAGMCAFLTMVGEYDERRGWASWEALSCAHWLNWRCGVGIVAAREQVRVARRLRELPVVHAHFARGALSYSKVRAITRVAHPGNEAQLVDLARVATAAQVERCCAALRRCEDNRAAERALRDGEELAQLRRSLSWHHDDSGDLIVRARIPAGAAADSFLAAIRASTALPPPRPSLPSNPCSCRQRPADTDADACVDEPLDALECRRLDALLDLVCAGAQAESSLAPQPEIVVHVTVPPGAAAPTAPTDPTDPVTRDPTDPSPADPTDPADPAGPAGRCPMADPVRGRPPAVDAGTRGAVLRQRHALGGRPHAVGASHHLGGAVDDLLPRSATSFDLGRHRRFPDRRLRRAVQRRDRGTCRFPGCSRRHRLHIHHIVFWEHGGCTDLDNLLALCPVAPPGHPRTRLDPHRHRAAARVPPQRRNTCHPTPHRYRADSPISSTTTAATGSTSPPMERAATGPATGSTGTASSPGSCPTNPHEPTLPRNRPATRPPASADPDERRKLSGVRHQVRCSRLDQLGLGAVAPQHPDAGDSEAGRPRHVVAAVTHHPARVRFGTPPARRASAPGPPAW